MKKNYVQLNKQVGSKSKKQPEREGPQQPLTIPDKIKNIEKKLQKLEDNRLQQRILEQMRIIKEELREIRSNMNISKSHKKSTSFEENVEESVVKTNKSKSIGKQQSQDIPSNQSIKIKQSKPKRVVTVPKEIISPSVLQAYLKDYKIEGTKPAPYYFGYIKKNSAPIFIKYSTKSLAREKDAYRRLWRDIVKARWICLNRLYDVGDAQIDFLVLDKNVAALDELSATRVLAEIVKILEFVHNCGYLYRNVSPQHFMLNADNKLVILDFKNMRRFVDAKGNHLEVIEANYQCGDFGSTAQLRLMAEGRKDDLESLGYMALHLLVGEVAWMGMSREQMMKCRNGLTLQQLYKPIPEWLQYMKYVHKLGRIQKPDYNYLLNLVEAKQ